MERQGNAQTTPGEHPASSSLGRFCSAPLARLAPTTPAACLLASASPAPGGPDGANSREYRHFFLSDDLSGQASALPLIMGRAAGSQCPRPNGWPGDDPTVRRPRSLCPFSRPGDSLTRLRLSGCSHSSEQPPNPSGTSWLFFPAVRPSPAQARSFRCVFPVSAGLWGAQTGCPCLALLSPCLGRGVAFSHALASLYAS